MEAVSIWVARNEMQPSFDPSEPYTEEQSGEAQASPVVKVASAEDNPIFDPTKPFEEDAPKNYFEASGLPHEEQKKFLAQEATKVKTPQQASYFENIRTDLATPQAPVRSAGEDAVAAVGSPFATLGREAAGASADVAGNILHPEQAAQDERGLFPNFMASVMNAPDEPLPIEKELGAQKGVSAAIKRGLLGTAKLGGQLAGVALTGPFGLPEALTTPIVFGASTFSETHDPKDAAISAALGAAFPIVDNAAAGFSANATKKLLLAGKITDTQAKVIEAGLKTGAMQATMQAMALPQYASNPENWKEIFAENAAQGIVFSLGDAYKTIDPKARSLGNGLIDDDIHKYINQVSGDLGQYIKGKKNFFVPPEPGPMGVIPPGGTVPVPRNRIRISVPVNPATTGVPNATITGKEPETNIGEYQGTTPGSDVRANTSEVRQIEGQQAGGGDSTEQGAGRQEAPPNNGAKNVLSPEATTEIRQKLFSNMQGREMQLQPGAFETADAHLKLVLGKDAPTWQELSDAGIVQAVPRKDGGIKVRVNTQPDPDWSVRIQSPQVMPDGKTKVAGFVQIGDAAGKVWSSIPEKLRAQGYDIPDFSNLPQGKYSYDEALQLLGQKPEKQTKPSLLNFPLTEVPANEIAARPDVMQFKDIGDEKTGENQTEKLAGMWDESKAGLLMLWEPKDPAKYGLKEGQKYIVANGHHRFAFGEREGVKTYGSQIYKESDGYSAQDARRIAAEANIADGKGTVYDQVKYLRNSPSARTADARMEAARRIGNRGRKAVDIAFNAGDDLYAAFVNEKITPEQAQAIALASPANVAAQRVGIKFALEGKSPEFLDPIVRRALQETGGKAQDLDLFGNDDSLMKSMAAEEAKAEEIRQGIRDQIRSVQGAAKNPKLARKLGVDVKDPASILQKVEGLKAQLERWQNWFLSGNEDLQKQIRGKPLETKPAEPVAKPLETKPVEETKPKRTWEEEKARLKQVMEEKQAEIEKNVKAAGETGGVLLRMVDDPKRTILVTPDIAEPGKWRITYVDDRGPSGHNVFDTREAAIRAASGESFSDMVKGAPYVSGQFKVESVMSPEKNPKIKLPWEMTRAEYANSKAVALPANFEAFDAIAKRNNREPYNPDLITDEAVAALKKAGLISGTKNFKITNEGFSALTDARRTERENSMATGNASDDHVALVEQALKEGKPVPDEVLKDYPELQPAKPAEKPTLKLQEPESVSAIERVRSTENGGRLAIVLPNGKAVIGGRFHADLWNKAIEAGVATDKELAEGFAGFVKPDGTAWGVNGKPLPKVSEVYIVDESIPKPSKPQDRPAAPLELAAPESVEAQKARVAEEERLAKIQAEKDKLAEAAAKPLVGSRGDIGQRNLLGGDEDLFSAAPAKKAEEVTKEPEQTIEGTPENAGRVELKGGDKFHSDISGTIYQIHNEGKVLDVIKDGRDYPVRVNVEDYSSVKFGPAEEKPAEVKPEKKAEPPAEQRYKIGTSPQTHVVIERLPQTEAEKELGEQPVRVKNDQTGEESVVLEQDLKPVKTRTEEERKAGRAPTTRELDEQLQKYGLDPEAYPDKASKKAALKRAKAKDDPAADLGEGLPDGQGMSPQEVKDVVGNKVGDFEVKVISKDDAERITGVPEARGYGGFFYEGKVYVVSDNIHRGNVDGLRELLREENAHGLLRTADGTKLLQSVLNEGKLQLTEAEKKALRDRGYQEHQLLDEFIAKSARENRGWWKRAVDTVREWLSKAGLAELTNEETARLLLKQIKRVQEGKDSFADAVLPELAPGEAVPEEERRARRPRHQVAGVKDIGEEYDPENIAQTQRRIRESYFDGTQPVDATRTTAAWDLANQMTDPERRSAIAQDIRNTVDAEMGPGLAVKELWDYAVKMTAAQDDSLLRFIVTRYADFEAQAGGGSLSKSATVLRTGGELASNPLWKGLKQVAIESARAAGRKLGVGQDLLNTLVSRINELNLSPEEVENVVREGRDSRGRTIDEILEAASPMRAAVEGALEQYDPRVRNTAFDTVYEFLKQNVELEEQPFVNRLTDALMRLGNEDIDEPLARQIAEQTWTRKNTVETARRRAAWDRELKELDERAQRTAFAMVNKMEKSQIEWQKNPERRNETLKVIQEALNPKTPLPAQNPALFKNPLRDRLIELGVNRETAISLVNEIYEKRLTAWSNARAKAMSRAAQSQSLRSLIEAIQSSPYRAQKDPAWRQQTAEDWFMSNGLGRDQAQTAARLFSDKFEEALKNAGEKIARKILEGKPTKTVADVIRLLRAGLTDPERNWSDELAKEYGWKPLTKEQHETLAALEEKRNDPSLSPQEFANVNEEMMSVFRHVGTHEGAFMRAIAEGFTASLLSGVRTLSVQFAPVLMALRDYPIMALSNPTNALPLATSMWNAARHVFGSEIKYAWQKDAYGFHLEELDRSHKDLKRIFEDASREYANGNVAQKAWARTKQLYALQKFVSQALSSMDQAMMAVTREWKLAYYASIAMKEAGLSTTKIADLVDAVSIARQTEFEKALAEGLDVNTAKVRANSRMDETVRDFVENKTGSSTLAAQTLKAAENDIYSVVGRKAEGIQETDEGFATRFLGINAAMQKLSEIRGQGGIPSLLAVATLGFVNIPLRTTRFFSSLGPYGLLRSGIHEYRNNRGLDNYWKQSFANQLQARARLREAIAGTVAMIVASAWAASHSTADDDAKDKKFGLYITGSGPSSRVLKDAFDKAGWKPYSLNFVINGHVAVIPITRVGESLMYPFILPAALDDAAWKKKEMAANGRDVKPISLVAGQLVATSLYMMGQKGILQGVEKLSQASQGGTGFLKASAKVGSGIASAAVLPFKQLLQSASDMFVGPIDQSSASAIIAASFPVVGLPWQQKAFNRFGDELYDRSWYGKIYRTGIPFAIQVSKTPENEQLYQTLVDKGAAPPELRRYAIEERYGELSDEQWAKFAKLSGQLLKQTVVGNVGSFGAMSPEDVKKFLTKSATAANNDAAAALGLEPQEKNAGNSGPSGASGASGASNGVNSPSVGSGRLPGLTAARGGGKSSSMGNIRRISAGSTVSRGASGKISVKRLKVTSRRIGGVRKTGIRTASRQAGTTRRLSVRKFTTV